MRNCYIATFTGPLVRENMKRVIVFVSLIFLCANIFCSEIDDPKNPEYEKQLIQSAVEKGILVKQLKENRE